MKTPPQPKTLTVNGKKYRLVLPYRVIDEAAGKAEGPSYRLVPDAPGLWFFPDLSYLTGVTKRPSTMNPVRLAATRGARSTHEVPGLFRALAKTTRQTSVKRSRR